MFNHVDRERSPHFQTSSLRRIIIVMQKIKLFFQRTLFRPFLSLLTQGLSPEKLALTVVSGGAISTFPVIGSTTILCTAASAAFGLNLPAIQLVNYFAFPLQLLLLPVLIRLGEILFGASPISLSALQILTMLHTDAFGAVRALWWATLHAIVAWAIIAPPTAFLLYKITVPVFVRLTLARVHDQE